MESSETPSDSQITTLKSSLEQLQRKAEIIKDLDAKIALAIQDPSELEGEIFESEEIQDAIIEKTGSIKEFLSCHAQSGVPAKTQVTQTLDATVQPFQPISTGRRDSFISVDEPLLTHHSSTDNRSLVQTHDNRAPSVSRLPKLSLPTFSGEPLSWQTFWDSFSAAVDSNHTLSGVQKFNYLRAQLQGDAARAIAGFPLTDANYTHSIDLLRERFGQSHKIVNAHMQALLDLPNPSSDMTELRRFYDSVENHIRGLSSLGKSQESYGALLIPIILGKLPMEIRHNLAREHSNPEWTIDELRGAILKEIQILEQGLFITSTALPSSI